jgi:hypothetical protein
MAEARGDLTSLLDRQRAALLCGDFSTLADLASAIDQAVEAGLPAANLPGLARRADENRSLITAALTGIRAARRRLDEVRTAPGGFTAYDAGGRPVQVTR